MKEIAQVALSALEARGVTVAPDGAAGVTVGEARGDETSVPIPGWSGERVGTLRVYGARRPDGADHPALVEAFARHLGPALTWPGAPADDPGPVEFLDWDDLERLDGLLDVLTDRVAAAVRPLVGARAVGITVWDADRGTLRALPGAFGVDDDRLSASVTGPVRNMASVGNRVFATGHPYVSNDAAADPGVLAAYVQVFGIHRILSVPLAAHDRCIGVLHVVDKPSPFTPDDMALVRALGTRLTFTVELARSVAATSARRRLEAVLARTAVGIASGGPVQICLLPAFDELAALTGASVVGLVPLESAPLLRRSGPPDPDLEQRLIADALECAAEFTGAYPRRAGDPGWAALHAPVELDGERTATLSVLRRTGQPFTAGESDVVVRLARLVALAWTTERYQHQLAEIARLRERERIADELHDRVAQILYAAQLGLDAALEAAPEPAPSTDVVARMIEVRDLLVHGDSAVRSVIRRLGPAPEPGLARRLRREIEGVEDEFGVAVRVEIVDDELLLAVPRPVGDAAVKVVREGTVNAAKHAGPCRIAVSAQVAGTVLAVTVHDDGFGLRTSVDDARGMGLPSLRRAVEDVGGELTVTGDTLGTRLAVHIPV